jgi:hypothetical protein
MMNVDYYSKTSEFLGMELLSSFIFITEKVQKINRAGIKQEEIQPGSKRGPLLD